VRDLDDEQRIAYVGMARARVTLGLRYAAERYGTWSREASLMGSA
jgi:superfamily I DNA/RNA helicase